ncbi:MAG: PAS domain S-box protein [Candidatus Thorarchaeota archaeon]
MKGGEKSNKLNAKRLIEDLKKTWVNSNEDNNRYRSLGPRDRKKEKQSLKPLKSVTFNNKNIKNKNNTPMKPNPPFKPSRDRFPKPPEPDFYLGQGLSFYNKGEYKKAINCFQIVLDVEPDNIECHYKLKKAKKRLKEISITSEELDKNIKEQKFNDDALSNISDTPLVTNKIPNNLIELLSKEDQNDRKENNESPDLVQKLRILSEAIDLSTEGISLTSPDGNLVFVNTAFANMHGYDQNSLIGKPSNTFQSKDKDRLVENTDNQIQKTGEYPAEEWHKRSDGSIFPTATHKSLLRYEDGTPIGILSTHRDITKLKRSEEEIKKLSSAVKQSIDGIAIYDLESKIIYANEAFAKMHGYSIEFLMGLKIEELYHNDQKEILKKMIGKILEGGSWKGEINRIKKDNSVFPSFISATLLTNMFGEPTGFLTITRDITERKRMERKIRKYTVHLEKKVKKKTMDLIQSEKLSSLGHLVKGIAQEINNPLGYLTSNTELIDEYIESIKDSIKDEEIIEKLETINDLLKTNQKGIDRIIKTTRALERFALPYRNEKGIIDINKGLKDTIHLLSGLVRDKINIHEDFNILPDIIGNTAQLNQIFMNIILNATEAMEKGEIWINTTVVNKYIKIEIKDNGKGIPGDIIDRVFDPFFTTKKLGKGLGLSIAYRNIQQYNGKISIYSKVGKGTKVTIRIPTVTMNDRRR